MLIQLLFGWCFCGAAILFAFAARTVDTFAFGRALVLGAFAIYVLKIQKEN